MLKRYTPLKRSSKPLKRAPLKRSTKRIARVSKRRRKERAEYRDVNTEYLAAHPLCQLMIAVYRLDERQVLAAYREYHFEGARCGFHFAGKYIPHATQVHHRNKCNGVRLTDERWFTSASEEMHRQVEDNKGWARKEGFLLPFEADPDGRLPNGEQCLTTAEWLISRSSR